MEGVWLSHHGKQFWKWYIINHQAGLIYSFNVTELLLLVLLLLQVLTENLSLDPTFCKVLLQQPSITTLSSNVTFPKPMEDTFSPGLRLLTGYPSYPLYNRLIETLRHWTATGWALNESASLVVANVWIKNIGSLGTSLGGLLQGEHWMSQLA